MSCPTPGGAVASQWLPLNPMGALAALGVSLWEGDIHPLPLGKVLAPAMGLLKSLQAVGFGCMKQVHDTASPTLSWDAPPLPHPVPSSPHLSLTQKACPQARSNSSCSWVLRLCTTGTGQAPVVGPWLVLLQTWFAVHLQYWSWQ